MNVQTGCGGGMGRVVSDVETVSFANMTTRLIAGGAGPVTILEMRIGQGGGAPAHRSLDEAKTFIVLTGRLQFLLGEVTTPVVSGDVIEVAEGVVHGFSNPDEMPAQMMLVATPARHDGFFRAMAALPVPHDVDAVRRVCETYRQEIMGL